MKRHATQYSDLPFTFKDTQSLAWLTDYSSKDKPWDIHRAQADDVGSVYAAAFEFERLAARIDACSGFLGFTRSDDSSTGESRLKLKTAQFCRVRYCPVCQWRRSLMWQARFYQALPLLINSYPKSRWLFLTLTIRNCEITELGSSLDFMNEAWQRFVKRLEFKHVQGWLRTTEVTRGKDRSAHPHFHVLLMVPPSMLSGVNYVKHSRWVEIWQEVLKVNYLPNVDVRTVKSKVSNGSMLDSLKGAVAETLKYSTKPADMTTDSSWFLELTHQTRNRRFLASGGVLKNVLKEGLETNEDLILADADGLTPSDSDSALLLFEWKSKARRYKRKS